MGEIYYEVRALDARGQVLEDWRGIRVDFTGDEAVAGLVSKRSYRPDTGWLTGIETNDRPAAGGRRLQHWTVGHDNIGNVLFREDAQRTTVYREVAQYDDLNRLTVLSRHENGAQTQISNYGYDDWGNLTGKPGFSNVAYNAQGTGCTAPSGPHAIASAQVVNVDGYDVGPLSFCYDANGNMTSMRRGAAVERSMQYTPAEQVREIASVSANQTIHFDYGPDRKRYQRREYNASATLLRTVRYLGNVEVIDVPPGLGVSEVKRYIAGALVITLRSDGGGSKAYLYTDPQGSTDLVTDRFGNVGTICKPGQPGECRQIGQRQGFDAFGLRRRVETTPVWQVLPWASRQSFDTRHTSRGYTGHESVDPVGLVHMNGRLYDPLIGRFIQPDPIIQDPYDTQSHNRYSYVLNNPLSAVDPSGNLSVRQAVLTVAAIVVTYYTGGAAISLMAEGAFVEAAAVAAAGGFVAGGLTTGTLKGALAGSFGSLATMGVGASFAGMGEVLAQGAVGGVMSELQGGKFGHGFASAGMSAALNPAIAQGVQGDAGRLVAHAALGGTVSVVAGGKFANGAVTAAFAYAFGSAARGGPSVAGSGAGSGIDASAVPSGDVLGTPAMDAQALQDAEPMSNTAPIESSLVRLRGGGIVSPIRCTNSECSYPATAFGAEFVVHAHVPSNYTGRVKTLIDQMRLLPSAGDHSFLVHANAPNYVKNVAGNVNVLEYTASGGYQVRWLTGPSAGRVQSWSPAQMNETRAFREANRRR